MVLAVSPIRTVGDYTPLEYGAVTITSRIDQTVEVYRDATLVWSAPLTANTPEKAEFDLTGVAGYYDLRVVGVTAGEWRGRVALTGTQYFITFVDEEGEEFGPDLNLVYVNLDETFLINPKRTKYAWGRKYTLSGRWVLEVGKKELDGTFRYDIVDLATIAGDTRITLPKLREAMIAVKIDLGLMWPRVITGVQAIDFIMGTVASALGFTDYPSLATYIINYVGNTLPFPPHSWELEGNTLTIYYKVTPDFFGAVGAVALFIIFVIALALPWILETIQVVATELGETARSENQRRVAEEQTKATDAWLRYAQEQGLTAQETLRGQEAITSSYRQMSQDVEPKPIPWETWLTIGIVAVVIIAVLGFLLRR